MISTRWGPGMSEPDPHDVRVAEYTSGTAPLDFLSNNMMKAAVVREIEIIGEATYRISPPSKDENCTTVALRLQYRRQSESSQEAEPIAACWASRSCPGACGHQDARFGRPERRLSF